MASGEDEGEGKSGWWMVDGGWCDRIAFTLHPFPFTLLTSFLPRQGDLGEGEHLQNVGGSEFVAEAEAEDVEVEQGAAGFDGK